MSYKLGLSQQEERALTELSQKKRMSKKNVLRASFRLYQTIEVKLENGDITPQQLSNFLNPGLRKKK
jgi:hypothetical protein